MDHSITLRKETAEQFATRHHHGQMRKYTGEPYIVHPLAVREIVRSVPHTQAMLDAAVLHDVVEDTDATIEDVLTLFGEEVADLVSSLTDISVLSDGRRSVRKEIDRQHTASASPQAKTVKLADLIHNTRSIVDYDPDFARIYLAEKGQLLQVLREGDHDLYIRATALLEESLAYLDSI